MDIAFAIKIFSALFAIMNPIANLPIFLSLTTGMTPAEQRRTAILVTVTVAVGSVISAVAGTAILGFFGLDVNHFRLAGGLIVLLIALNMLNGESSPTHAGSPDEQKSFKSASNVAFYPLSIPILLGPGTISALVVYAHQARAGGDVAAFSIGLVAFIALLGAVLISGPFIARILSPTIMTVTKRLMGMILAAIAMEMLVASLTALFPGWAG
jgi:multiple antibiotic resistance protein